MKGLVITSKGLEETACMELKELINAYCKPEESCVIFDFKKFEELCLLCYKCQSADRILYLMGSFEFSDFFSKFEKFIDGLKLDGLIGNNKNFKVECLRMGTHEFKSVDVESKAAGLLLKKIKLAKFDIKNWDMIFFVYIVDSKCYFGIDFGGFELNKRAYKIFLHPGSLRGTIAYALLRETGFGKKDIMLDPFSRDGIIAIESAFYAADFPVNYFKKDRFAFLKLEIGVNFERFFKSLDAKVKKPKAKIYAFDHLFKYIDYSKKNAKIAGVEKRIDFSRTELEWLDLKFKEKSIDKIITNLPSSKNSNLDKIYNEFFYQSAYILKDSGLIGIIARIPELAAKHAAKHSFTALKEKNVWSGEQVLKIVIFKRKNR